MARKDELVLCGGILVNGEITGVYHVPSEGALAFYNDMDGIWYYISETSVKAVLEQKDLEVIDKEIKSGSYGNECIGVAFCDSYAVVVMNDTVADTRQYSNLKDATAGKYDMDLDTECEIEEE